MRARLALLLSGLSVVLREVDLKNKPPALLQASPKGTVPVLVLQSGEVIDKELSHRGLCGRVVGWGALQA